MSNNNINNRWRRNLPNIISLEKKKEDIEKNIEKLEEDDEKVEELKLEIADIDNEIERLKISFDELIASTREDIKKLYLNSEDDGDWSIAWSGGKDSTTVVGLVIDMLKELSPEQRKRKVHVVMSDTTIENPILETYMHEQIKKLKKYVVNSDLPCEVHLVKRELNNSYFYLTLGKGYFLPQRNGKGRWCTERLKTAPQKKIMKKINPSYQLIGVRMSESSKRKNSIKNNIDKSSNNRKVTKSAKNIVSYMPIIDFTIEDVWEYLQRNKLAWTSTHDVRTLYKEATGECGFTNPKGTEAKANVYESCGARFGCWVCPVVLNDRSTETMSNYHDWMKPLTEFRMLQLKVMGEYKPTRPEGQRKKVRGLVLREAEKINKKIKEITKSGHKRDGKRYIDSKGVAHNDKGATTLEAREYLFNKLIETEKEVNRLRELSGLGALKLISDEEIELIKKQWSDDRENLPCLITNVNGLSISELDKYIEKMNRLEKNQPIDIDFTGGEFDGIQY